MNTRELRVFVSSTFRDMKAERDYLVKFIFPQLRKLCESRAVTWTDVDLRWGIPEEEAAEGKVLPLCLEEVHRCRPYFIGLLGERYGSMALELQPELIEREPWLEKHRGKSITELEIVHGVLRELQMRGHAFFYFRDPEYINHLPAGSRRADFESESELAGQMLKRLKEEIRRARDARVCKLRENYRNPEVLGRAIRLDLTRLINQLFPESERPDGREHRDHEAFAQSRARVYVGRRTYFDRLDAHVASTNDRPLVVLGDSGIGKSALLANWLLKLRSIRPNDFALIHFIGASPDSANPNRLLARVMLELKRRFPDQFPNAAPVRPEEIRGDFVHWITRASDGARIILILDGLNQLEERDGAGDLGWLPAVFPGNCRVILSTLPGRSLETTRKREWPEMTVLPLTALERKTLIEEFLAQFSKKLNPEDLEHLASAEQTANPLFLRALLDELRQFGQHGLELHKRIKHYLTAQGPSELYQRILERWEEDYGEDLVRQSLSFIWAARHGVSEAELLDLLGRNGRLPRAKWTPLGLAAESSLVRRSGLLSFSHNFIREAVRRRALSSSSAQQQAHRRLADYFAEQDFFLESLEAQRARARSRPPTSRPANRRKVEELVYQRRHAGQQQDVEQLLTDPLFLEATAEAGLIFEILVDFTTAIDPPMSDPPEGRRALRLIESAIRQEAHLIAVHPTGLFQCVWNKCWCHEDEIARANRSTEGLPASMDVSPLAFWRSTKERTIPGFTWMRSLRPNPETLGPMVWSLSHPRPVSSVAFDTESDILASGCEDGSVRVWDCRRGVCTHILDGLFPTDRGISKPILSCFISAKHRLVAAGAYGELAVWNYETSVLKRKITLPVTGHFGKEDFVATSGHFYWATLISLAADGNSLIISFENQVANDESFIGFFSIRDDTFRQGPKLRLWGIQTVSDKTWIICPFGERRLRVLDSETGETVMDLGTRRATTRACAVSRDGARLALTTDIDAEIHFIDIPSRSVLASSNEYGEQTKIHRNAVRCCRFFGGRQYVAAGDKEGQLIIWSPEIADTIAACDAHSGAINAISATRDETLLATASDDGFVKVWNAHAILRSQSVRCDQHEEGVYCCEYTEDGYGAYTGSYQRMLRPSSLYKWRLGDEVPQVERRILTRWSFYAINSMTIVPGAELLAHTETEGKLILRSAATGEIRESVKIPYRTAIVQLVPHTRRLLLMRPYRHFNYPDYGFDERQSDEHSPDFGILSYDLDMKTLRSFLPPDERKRNCVAFSADGELMALGTDDGEVEVWNVSQRIRNDTIKIGATAVRCCTFSPDGAILAAGMSDGRLATINLVADRGGRQLELRDAVERISQPEHIGEFCRIRLAHDGPVTCLGFLKNGFRLFSGGADGDVKVWDLLLALETQYRCTAGVLTATKHPRQEELLIGDRGGHVYFLKYESVVDETSPPPCGQ